MHWALINCEESIGVTAHFVDEEIDNGDILFQDEVSVGRDETIVEIQDKLNSIAAKMACKVMKHHQSGSLKPQKQDSKLATYWPPRTPEEGKIDWNKSSREIHRMINALCSPYPNAFSATKKGKTKFQRSLIGCSAGVVLAKTLDEHYIVSTGDGIVMLESDTALDVGDVFE